MTKFEKNFSVKDPNLILSRIIKKLRPVAKLDTTDGASFEFEDWRFNIRKSNTESLLRLNVESKGMAHKLDDKVKWISEVINNFSKE